ncbi:response regulator transcription factor [Shewanella sedimentimangrovi]|uniref:Response regulator transcription factor n=1 Tax=Shewanella sedimentimangrovi TaxID=2814293 RepID=A0ABX7R3F5_9GAMM|nr:response regulator transcription factor [Shewanella sedimentimangrovi]QSX37691.1 response regulator transcription factor [Shewanella sedimentimangrovi]
MSAHILLLEDDPELTRLIKLCLENEGYMVSTCANANRAEFILQQQQVDLLICDVMLPGRSGFDFVSEIRSQTQCPILFMTAKTSLQNQLHGLSLGAQDYLLKPIDPRLLLAKIKVFLGRPQQTETPQSHYSQFNLSLNALTRRAELNGQLLELTTAEFQLLEALLAHFGTVVSREFLFQRLLGRSYDGMARTMDGRASRLRKKLQAIDDKWNVQTSWGEGYYLSYGEPEL